MTYRRFLLFCIFAIPFVPQGVGLSLGSNYPILDLPRILLACLLISWFLKKAVSGEPLITLKWNSVTKLFVLLIIIQFLSIFVSHNYPLSFFMWLGYLINYFGIFFILQDEIKKPSDWKKIVNIIVLLTVCLAAISCLEFVLNQGIYDNVRNIWAADQTSNFEADRGRIIGMNSSMGPFASTQPLGFFYAATFFLVLNAFLSEKVIPLKLLKLTAVLITIFGVFATQVRGAILAIAFTFILSLIRKKSFDHYLKYIFLISVILIVAASVLFYVAPPRFFQFTFVESVSKTTSNESTLYKRIDGLRLTMQDLTKKPLLGYGVGAVPKHSSGISNFSLKSDLPLPIAFWIESGILAFMFYSLMIINIVLLLYKRYKKEHDTQKKELLYYLAMSIIAFSIATLSAPSLESSFIFFVILAVANGLIINEKNKKVSLF
ncbi:O-antigen ligase family protein [Candidatus Kuenenbacteria bacterium]|nr:O-antigen ligase family protein [Candidatus Kuenenbacteria bacterium]